MSEMTKRQDVSEDEVKQYLMFEAVGLQFGVATDQVYESLSSYSITPLPLVPNYVRGIINMRGQVLPVIDIRQRLGHPPLDEFLMIILHTGENYCAILADDVTQRVNIAQSQINSVKEQNLQILASGACFLPDGGSMFILDSGKLLTQ